MPTLLLSDRERAILRFVDTRWRECQYGPAYRDFIAGGVATSTSIIRYNCLLLERKGLLRMPRDDRQMLLAHTMQLTDSGRAALAKLNANGHLSTDTQP